MEKALQECCRSMRIGKVAHSLFIHSILYLCLKVLVDSDSETHEAHVVFAKFPDDIANRKVIGIPPLPFIHSSILHPPGVAALPHHEEW